MRLVADENIDRVLVEWLRRQGHDVIWIVEATRGVSDDRVVVDARAEHRVILTADLDYGELVFHQGQHVAGIVLLRFQTTSPEQLLTRFIAGWKQIESVATGAFTVMSNDKVRVRPLPLGPEDSPDQGGTSPDL